MQKYDDNGNRGSIVARSVRVSKYPILYIIYPNFIESTALYTHTLCVRRDKKSGMMGYILTEETMLTKLRHRMLLGLFFLGSLTGCNAIQGIGKSISDIFKGFTIHFR